MRKFWKNLIPVAITFLILAGYSKSYQKENSDNDSRSAVETNRVFNLQTARILGHVYVLALPINDHSELVSYIQQNRSYFGEDSPVIKCAKALGNRLVYQGLRSFIQDDYDRAYGRVLEMGGTMEMAQKVRDDISRGSVDLVMLGEELLWLAEVLPYAANGNWVPFQTTGTEMRNQIRLLLPFLKMMLEADPAMAQIWEEMMKQLKLVAVEHIVMLAIMLGA